jgi:hypothetical protein
LDASLSDESARTLLWHLCIDRYWETPIGQEIVRNQFGPGIPDAGDLSEIIRLERIDALYKLNPPVASMRWPMSHRATSLHSGLHQLEYMKTLQMGNDQYELISL